MKIALIGASGLVGSRLLTEALSRGHAVSAIVRTPSKLTARPGLTALQGDVNQPDVLAGLLRGHDVVISAFSPSTENGGADVRALIDATKGSGVKRLLVVGGAGSLEVRPGERLVDQPGFPAQWKAGALATAAFLDRLRTEPDLDWTFLSPAPRLEPGERTGRFRLGGDQLLDPAGRISIEDYAVAMLDEAERPAHTRTRFSVTY